MPVLITGAEDSQLQVHGDIREDFEYARGELTLRFSAPTGETLLVQASYDISDRWVIKTLTDAENGAQGFPQWFMRYMPDPDDVDNAALWIDLPEDSTVEEIYVL